MQDVKSKGEGQKILQRHEDCTKRNLTWIKENLKCNNGNWRADLGKK